MNVHWSWPKKLGFLFLSYYIVLYAFSTQFITSAVFVPIWKKVVPWFASLVGHPETITIFPAGSGDTTYNYYEVLWFAVLAILLAIFTVFLDSRRSNYVQALKWVSLLLRYYLAAQMISYGLAKLYYMQFSYPSAARFDQKLGDFSPMGLLWTFMGYSKGYTMFTGALEFVGGILLLSRYTTTVGALTTFGVMLNVMMLNFCYDVPVKLLSSHLVAFAFFLMLLDGDRLISFFITNRTVKPRMLASIANEKQQKLTTIVKWILVLSYLGFQIYSANKDSHIYGPKSERPKFHGKYEVYNFEKYNNGTMVDSLAESDTWSAFYQSWEGFAFVKNKDESNSYFDLRVDTNAHILKLRLRNETDTLFQQLKYDEFTKDRYMLNGYFYGDSLSVIMDKVPLSNYQLDRRGFHWINEYPFNR